ncbi:ubiquitin-activating enzyme E1 2-like [Iris pallida]|uniref:Ubiquitin-activating enzyme E1 2-like n=1 Tax=Iris pallida TaxID=29817 RepID=A0AAX6H6G7_IRIPA|nr:ubiquitin-activating enzyme E1 2-like [Iris pallida]
MFCDFGPKFTVTDVDREEPHTGIIEVKILNSRSPLPTRFSGSGIHLDVLTELPSGWF